MAFAFVIKYLVDHNPGFTRSKRNFVKIESMDELYRADYERYRNELLELEQAFRDTIERVSLALAKMLITFDDEHRRKGVKDRPEQQLKGIYMVALDNEYYEVCKVIKEELESRN